jgi:hypothetical protein
MLLLIFGLGAAFGAVVGVLFALRHSHSFRRKLADEMRHELFDEFSQRFRHIETHLEYLESAIMLQLLSQNDTGAAAPRLPGSRAS